MDWKDPQKAPIPPRKEILIITDLGELFVAYRSKKNSAGLEIKGIINGKVEWVKNAIKLKCKVGRLIYCPIVYWCEVKNLTKKQFKAKFEMHTGWDKMFEH